MKKQLQRGWEVEWCTYIPLDDKFGGLDYDRATYRCKDFATEDDAFKFAKTVLPQDQFGSVRVTEFWLEAYEPGFPGTYKEYGRQEYVE